MNRKQREKSSPQRPRRTSEPVQAQASLPRRARIRLARRAHRSARALRGLGLI